MLHLRTATALAVISLFATHAVADEAAKARAVKLEQALTLDERISMVNGTWPVPWVPRTPDNPQPAEAIPAMRLCAGCAAP